MQILVFLSVYITSANRHLFVDYRIFNDRQTNTCVHSNFLKISPASPGQISNLSADNDLKSACLLKSIAFTNHTFYQLCPACEAKTNLSLLN